MEDEKEMICDKSFSAWLQADPYTYIRPYTLALENPRGVGVKTNIYRVGIQAFIDFSSWVFDYTNHVKFRFNGFASAVTGDTDQIPTDSTGLYDVEQQTRNRQK